ncbi:MAG: glycosyltransferase family 8 protein [Spirochaetaceae bacterium]|nr:glycosyltransferase family 8 protein [Spirochaetaceae bacterium]
MNILVTLNSAYLRPVLVMLKSMFMNSQGEMFSIYLMHSSLKQQEIDEINDFVTKHGHILHVITVDDECFKEAPVVMHYSREMYYRLLAYKFLPKEVGKILYLDPDILVINNLHRLYDTDISDYLFAASYHRRMLSKEFNKVRLNAYDMQEYYNSGVLLMNVDRQRSEMDERKIFDFIARYKNRLVLPDQDVLNSLYSDSIRELNEVQFNLDTRFYRYNKLISNGGIDMDYIFHNTCILHFCGKRKPWHKNYMGVFHSLYKYYEKQANDFVASFTRQAPVFANA